MEIYEGKGGVRPTTVVVCTNCRVRADQPSCGGRGAEVNLEALVKGIAERWIDVTVERIVCFGYCPRGPNMRIAPGGAFFFRVGPEDVPAILDRLEAACGVLPEPLDTNGLRLLAHGT